MLQSGSPDASIKVPWYGPRIQVKAYQAQEFLADPYRPIKSLSPCDVIGGWADKLDETIQESAGVRHESRTEKKGQYSNSVGGGTWRTNEEKQETILKENPCAKETGAEQATA